MDEGVLIVETQTPVKKHNAVERLTICKGCPLFIRESEVCNPYMWMNPATRETSTKEKPGFIKGCGCLISRKARQPGSHCHLGLW